MKRLWEIYTHLSKLFSAAGPDIFVRELHNFSMSGNSNINHELNGIINLFAMTKLLDNDEKYFLIPPTAWKKFCVGKGNVAKDTAYLMKLNRFFSKFPWWDYGEIEDDNIADAIAIGITSVYFANRNKIESGMLTSIQVEALKKLAKVIVSYD